MNGVLWIWTLLAVITSIVFALPVNIDGRIHNNKSQRKIDKAVGRNKRNTNGGSSEECPHHHCILHATNYKEVQNKFVDVSSYKDHLQRLNFRIDFQTAYNVSLLDQLPYMGRNFRASEWTWISGRAGRQLLEMPLDAGPLSFYLMDQTDTLVQVEESPNRCFIMLSSECRMEAVRRLLINNITHTNYHRHRQSYVCHKYMKDDGEENQLTHKCCEREQYSQGIDLCTVFIPTTSKSINNVTIFIYFISVVVTLFSPLLLIKLKLVLQFNSVTKFFRASLKHGITGQRNYVIRISSRQLINLQDDKPFSIPRVLLRLILHCYGEGRCCIHWWGQWSAQPSLCRKQSCPQQAYFIIMRVLAIICIYPIVFYIAFLLYYPKLEFYSSVLDFTKRQKQDEESDYEEIDLFNFSQLKILDVNPIALILLPFHNPLVSLLVLYSLMAFLYTLNILSWPNNPLECCLLQYKGKRATDQPQMLYNELAFSYKDILHRLAYGESTTPRHLFRIPCLPWGMLRIIDFLSQLLMMVPMLNIAFTMTSLDNKLFRLRKTRHKQDFDELTDSYSFGGCSGIRIIKWIITIIIWFLFVLILIGYCIYVFLMVQFLLHLVFYTLLACIIFPSDIFPWFCLALVIGFYTNDILSTINREHRDILSLIDANSPRISAVEDNETNYQDGSIHILRSHNLGAVKFIDGDNTEYVSKELYYSVCTDLKCGWSHSIRRLFCGLTMYLFYAIFVFLTAQCVASFTEATIIVTISAVIISLAPKLHQFYSSVKLPKLDKKSQWAKEIPEVLDRHIRIDRRKCIDEEEVELSTYDVRPVGVLEMDLPKGGRYGNLCVWKFPWTVSADQQTQSTEGFLVALSSKLAAASFLGRLVTRHYPPELHEEPILRQWTLLVENCVMEGGVTANNINGAPLESVRIFPPEIQPLVSPFRTGSTIDSVVDNINRELYGPYTKGVLVTIGNTPIAIWKLDSVIFAFNAGCHGDQVTDLFGAVLIVTDFNTQNLQTVIKFIMDPYSPDMVPVYTAIATEGFIFRSPEILELESPVSSESRV